MELARNLSGVISGCPRCNGQPLLVECRGRDLFRMECPPCRVRLWDVPSATEAIACWEGLPRLAVGTDATQPRAAA